MTQLPVEISTLYKELGKLIWCNCRLKVWYRNLCAHTKHQNTKSNFLFANFFAFSLRYFCSTCLKSGWHKLLELKHDKKLTFIRVRNSMSI